MKTPQADHVLCANPPTKCADQGKDQITPISFGLNNTYLTQSSEWLNKKKMLYLTKYIRLWLYQHWTYG